jgi:hypothetical protein
MFHVELRQFPHVARAFNLTREELNTQILAPWVAGALVECGDRRWAPERARLSIYEGPALRADEIGLGRGWANATRAGDDATARLLAETQRISSRDSALERLKQEVLGLCAMGRIDVPETVRLASALHPEWRMSDRLALAEQAVWQLLHAGGVTIVRDGVSIGSGQWQPLLMAWSTWSDQGGPRVSLEAK